MATFRKRGPYQWQAQVRKKVQPLQTKTFETRALAEQWVRDIKLSAVGKPRDRRLQAREETRLLAACQEARNTNLLPIVQLALETAMRQGELIRLRWEHIDLNRRTGHKDLRMLRRYTHLKVEDLATKPG